VGEEAEFERKSVAEGGNANFWNAEGENANGRIEEGAKVKKIWPEGRRTSNKSR
jgi:hypothetical protein